MQTSVEAERFYSLAAVVRGGIFRFNGSDYQVPACRQVGQTGILHRRRRFLKGLMFWRLVECIQDADTGYFILSHWCCLVNNGDFFLASGKSGRDDYAGKYRNDASFQAEWLRRGAVQKVDSIETLIARQKIAPDSILELGCGPGAVIGEIQRRGLASRCYGVDFSEHAISLMASLYPEVHGKTADVTKAPNPFNVKDFDVVVVSHTIEHLEHPHAFLQAIRQITFKYLIAEVPLEDLLFGKLKSVFQGRSNNSAGHVQFFTQKTFRELLRRAKYRITDEFLYAPFFGKDTLRFAYGQQHKIKQIQKSLTERWLPLLSGPLWVRLYHAHYAVICEKE